MTWIDIAVLATICILAGFGFWKGIVRAVIGIAGFLGGLLLAGALYRPLAEMIWPSGGTGSLIAAYAIIFFATLVVAAIVAALLSRVIHMTVLGVVDRVIGLVAGGFVAAMGWALLLALLVSLSPSMAELVAESPLAQALVDWSPAARHLLPDSSHTL